MKSTNKWLKLQLRDDQKMDSRYIIIHTHFAIYSHLLEQGFSIGLFEASNYERDQPNAVIYINTDHEGFYNSCCQYYAHDFDLSEQAPDFRLPAHYRLMFGSNASVSTMAS